jgi:hypothetical protein
LKHVNPSQAYIDRRFAKEKHAFLSYFTSKEAAERAIHKLLRDNSHDIDEWLKTAKTGEIKRITGTTSGSGTAVISRETRQVKTAKHIEVRIKNRCTKV